MHYEFEATPEYRSLRALSRSDNALVVLGIEARERSWTRFMRWCLCPDRRGVFAAATAAAAFLDVAAAASSEAGAEGASPSVQVAAAGARGGGLQVVRVRDEVGSGDGRLDLKVDLRVGDGRWSLLVENKIRASESPGQLAGYTRHWSARLGADRVIPVFFVLGDHPPARASARNAIVLNRGHARAWLEALLLEGKRVGVVADYLALLEAWDDALTLKRYHWDELERATAGHHVPEDWHLVRDWLSIDGRFFYAQVRQEVAYRRALAEHHSMRDSFMFSGKSQQTGIQFRPPHWRLTRPPDWGRHGVEVHYESVRRGELLVHVELSPYVSGLDKKSKAAERQRFGPQLSVRRELLTTLRAALLEGCADCAGFSVSTKGLRGTDRHSTLSAVRFTGPESARSDPGRCAAFIADVVRGSAGLIDGVVSAVRSRHGLP